MFEFFFAVFTVDSKIGIGIPKIQTYISYYLILLVRWLAVYISYLFICVFDANRSVLIKLPPLV